MPPGRKDRRGIWIALSAIVVFKSRRELEILGCWGCQKQRRESAVDSQQRTREIKRCGYKMSILEVLTELRAEHQAVGFGLGGRAGLWGSSLVVLLR